MRLALPSGMSNSRSQFSITLRGSAGFGMCELLALSDFAVCEPVPAVLLHRCDAFQYDSCLQGATGLCAR
jgi:hypothetical protein